MKRTIFRQTWAIVVGVPTAVIAGLIVNSLTEWWVALVLNQIRIGRDRGDGVCVWRLGQ